MTLTKKSVVFALSTAMSLGIATADSSNTLAQAQTLIQAHAQNISNQLYNHYGYNQSYANLDQLVKSFNQDYQNPIQTTTQYSEQDGTPSTYVLTGGWQCDGPSPNVSTPNPSDTMSEMWIRDADAQFHAYLGIYSDTKEYHDPQQLQALTQIIQGLIRTQAADLAAHPTAHAFNKDGSVPSAGVDYELDTPAFFISFSYDFWKASGDTAQFNDTYKQALQEIIQEVEYHQHYGANDQSPLTYTGMSWSGYRPSDDPTLLPFNIPDNMLLVVAMREASQIAQSVYGDTALATEANNLANTINEGINKYGIINTAQYGRIYAFEVDGSGNQVFKTDGQTSQWNLNFTPFAAPNLGQATTNLNNPAYSIEVSLINAGQVQVLAPVKDYTVQGTTLILKSTPAANEELLVKGNFALMDDANIPSLLAIPYMGYTPSDPSLYPDTRKFVLSPANPYYFSSAQFQGIGSPHIYAYTKASQMTNNVWPLALIAQGITSTEATEKFNMMNMLLGGAVNDGTYSSVFCPNTTHSSYPSGNYMHESFSVNDPHAYTRGWFAWPNAFFGEWVDNMAQNNQLPQ